jgi:hypothetical protein
MNTRRFPRSLNEAFPRTAEYAASIEVGRRPLFWHLMRIVRFMLRRFK